MSVIGSFIETGLKPIFRYDLPLKIVNNAEPMFWALWRYGTPVLVKLIYSIHI